jgi:hypothetical protein
MSDCKPCSMSVDTQTKVSSNMGPPVSEPTAYRSLAGALQYLTFTKPNIAYAVQQVCLHMHDPVSLISLSQSASFGTFRAPSISTCSTSDLIVYTNADCTGYPDTRRFTSGYVVFLGDKLISWSSNRQNIVSHSSAEVEYRIVANSSPTSFNTSAPSILRLIFTLSASVLSLGTFIFSTS